MEGQSEKKPKKKGFWMECPFGHRWYSKGTGQRAKCPICYEERTGKKLGRSPEEMAEMRKLIKRKPKEEAAAAPDDVVTTTEAAQPKEEPTPPISAPQPEPKPQEKSFFREFLGF